MGITDEDKAKLDIMLNCGNAPLAYAYNQSERRIGVQMASFHLMLIVDVPKGTANYVHRDVEVIDDEEFYCDVTEEQMATLKGWSAYKEGSNDAST